MKSSIVADHQFQSQFTGDLGLLHTRDAAIDSDDLMEVLLLELAKGIAVETIAFFNPIRNVVIDIRPGESQAAPEDC